MVLCGLNHFLDQIICVHDGPVWQKRELHGHAFSRAIGVVEQLPSGAVEDDAVIRIKRLGSDSEGSRGQNADRPDPGKDGIIKLDRVFGGNEVLDHVDIGTANRSIEAEGVVARATNQAVISRVAREEIGAVAAAQPSTAGIARFTVTPALAD